MSVSCDIKPTTDIKLIKRGGMVYISGNILFAKEQGGGYVEIAKLDKEYCPIVKSLQLVPLHGKPGHARLSWATDGKIQLKPLKSVWVNVSFPVSTTNDEEISKEYDWIKRTLMQIDSKEWDKYLDNFVAEKVTDAALQHITSDEDWKKLIPEIGIRARFLNLLQQKAAHEGNETAHL